MVELTPDILLQAYAMGVFPMAHSQDAPEIYWVDPHLRGVIPLDKFHVSRSLRKTLLKADYQVHLNKDFAACVAGCADRDETWINEEIAGAYQALHDAGHAHSVEIWYENQMVGGVYGVSIGAAFFGESMFSRRRDGSKIALAWLIARLQFGGYRLFDTQFVTDHLRSLGGHQIPRKHYQDQLSKALEYVANIRALPADATADQLFRRSSS